MTTNGGRRLPLWFKSAFISWDFGVAVGAGTVLGIAYQTGRIGNSGVRDILIGSVGLGVAVLGLALTGFAIVVSLSDRFVLVIEYTENRFGGLALVYLILGAIGSLGVAFSAVVAISWHSIPNLIRGVTMGVVGMFAAWCISGSFEALRTLALIGRKRAELLRSEHEAFRIRRETKSDGPDDQTTAVG